MAMRMLELKEVDPDLQSEVATLIFDVEKAVSPSVACETFLRQKELGMKCERQSYLCFKFPVAQPFLVR
jgi:hypothetical protein